LVDEGICCYTSMITDYMIHQNWSITPGMVDLLCHAGCLQIHGNVQMEECVTK
jgi:hypothetical protein